MPKRREDLNQLAFADRPRGDGAGRADPFFVYNFITRHGTLRRPPALKAHDTDHVWTLEQLVAMIDAYDPKPKMKLDPIPMDEV